MSPLLFIAGIFLVGGFLQGLTGFGAALIAMPLLCLFIDVKTAVPLCVLNSIAITSYLITKLNSHIDFRKVLPLCLSAIPGIYVGSTLLHEVNSNILSICLGTLLITYSLYNLAFSPRRRPLATYWAYLAGFSSGTIGSAFSTGGPPTIIYTTLNDWSKDQIKATLTAFFIFNSVITATVHAFTGLITPSVLHMFTVSCPSVLVGTILGSAVYNHLPRKTYVRIVFCFLALSGVTLLFPR